MYDDAIFKFIFAFHVTRAVEQQEEFFSYNFPLEKKFFFFFPYFHQEEKKFMHVWSLTWIALENTLEIRESNFDRVFAINIGACLKYFSFIVFATDAAEWMEINLGRWKKIFKIFANISLLMDRCCAINNDFFFLGR